MDQRPIVIVGGSGQIGGCLAQVFRMAGHVVVSTWFRNRQPDGLQLDAGDPEMVRTTIGRLRPWLVISSVNARGGTDACECDPALARRAHFETAQHLVDAALQVEARLVHLSTDYVFDGQAGPYAEADPPRPLSRLGQAKLEAEAYALSRIEHALVVRTSFVFSWSPQSQMKNFVMQLFEAEERGTVMQVPIDQIGNVTYAPNLAEAIVELVERGANGIYHVAGLTRCSKYEWARAVAKRFGLRVELIQGTPTAQLRQAGPRPLQSGFRLDKVQALLRRTRLMRLEEALEAMALTMQPAEART